MACDDVVCVQVTRDQVHKLEFPAPEEPGDASITVYLMSDCIAGLDQQYTMRMQCDPQCPHPQTN